MSLERSESLISPARQGKAGRDPVMTVSLGLGAIWLLLVLAPLASPGALAFYEAVIAALDQALAGMAVACQWTF